MKRSSLVIVLQLIFGISTAVSFELIPSVGVHFLELGSVSGPGRLAGMDNPWYFLSRDSLACLTFRADEFKKYGNAPQHLLVDSDIGILHLLRPDQLSRVVEKHRMQSLRDVWIKEIQKPSKRQKDSDKSGLYKEIELPNALPEFLKGKAGLKVSGRQRIEFGGESNYQVGELTDPRRSNSKFPQLQMEQELRVSLKGNVGDKISVLVDHDSSRQLDAKNTIRIRYEGTEDEIIQEIEAGNTSLSLGSGPEFITPSFSHQGLFGIRGRGQIGPATLTMIASKEESQKQSTSFTGQAKLDTIEIRDTQYVHNQFYSVVMEPGSPSFYDPQDSVLSIEVFLDDQFQAPTDFQAGFTGTCYLDPSDPSDEELYEGIFEKLSEGIENDYIFNRSSGILELNQPLQENHVLGVLYTSVNKGQVGSVVDDTTRILKLIKPANLTPDSKTWAYELRNVYYLGSREINMDRFRLKIKRKVPSGFDAEEYNGKSYLNILGLDNNNDGLVDQDLSRIDESRGILVFPYAEPFNRSDLLDTVNTALYSKRYSQLRADDHLYYLEASYELLQSTYSLSPFMIEGSVDVKVNGVSMREGADYDIEFYELRFRPGVIGSPSDQISVSYEIRPLFAASQKTLLGARVELPFSSATSLGATWMYQGEGGPKTTRFPRFGEEPRRSMVADIDGRMELRPHWLTDAVNAIPLVKTDAPSVLTFGGEIAYSIPNPNTRSAAYVDDMEGTRVATSLPLAFRRWVTGSLPEGMTAASQDSTFYWHNYGYNDPERLIKGDIYPDSLLKDTRERDDPIDVLNIKIHPDEEVPHDTWMSLQSLVQSGGIDFSEREFLEVLIRGDTGVLHFDFGAVSEDQVRGAAESNGILDEEDRNPRDGTFIVRDEDTGLDGLFNEQESGSGDDPNNDDYDYDETRPQDYTRINGTEGNALEDTEDLDGNGQLDRTEDYFSFRVSLDEFSEFVEGEYLNGWRLYRLPLEGDHVSRFGNADWSNIEYCRLWGTGWEYQEEVEVQVASIDIVGSTWLSQGVSTVSGDPVSDDRFRVKVRNNKEDPEYEPPYDPGEDEKTGYERREQSLVLSFEDLKPENRGSAYQAFYRDQDYSGYKGVAFWVRAFEVFDEAGLPVEPVLWIRLGANETNYYEIRIRVGADEWEKVEVDLDQLTRTKIDGAITTSEGYLLSVTGSPSITKVGRLTAGIENPVGREITGEVWIDDLHVTRVKRERGAAKRASVKLQLADLATLDADYRSLDATYRRLDQRGSSGATNNTSSSRISARISLDQFTPDHWGINLPLSLSWQWQSSQPRLAPGSDTPLSAEEQEEEKSSDTTRRISANLSKTKASRNPIIRVTVDRLRFSFSQTSSKKFAPNRADTTQSVNMSMDWDWSPGRSAEIKLPYIGNFRYLPSNISFGLSADQRNSRVYVSSGDSLVRSPARYTRNVRETAGFGLQPFKALTATYSFNATRDLTYDQDGNDLLDPENLQPTSLVFPFWEFLSARETGRNQKARVQLKPRMMSWFDPSISYDVSFNENNSPSLGGDTLDVRDVSATTAREVRVTISINQLFSKISKIGDGKTGLLNSIGSLGGKFQAIQGNIKRNTSSKYKDLFERPDLSYQLGLVEDIAGYGAYDRALRDSWGLSGGIQITKDLRMTGGANGSEDTRSFSGSKTGNTSTVFPDVDLSWTGFHKLGFLKGKLASSTIRSGFKRIDGSKGRYDGESFVTTGTSTKDDFSPRLAVTVRWSNGLTVTLGNNYSKESTEDLLQAQRSTNTSESNRTNLSMQYAFSAPQGMTIPIFGKMRFDSDLRLSLEISHENSERRVGSNLSSANSSWAVRPGASYDFGVVDSGLQLWVTENNNKLQDKKFRSIGLKIWIQFPF